MKHESMDARQRLLHLIEELEQDRSLDAPELWQRRMEALDRLESLLIHQEAAHDEAIVARASQWVSHLESRNDALYESLREAIRMGAARKFMACVSSRHANESAQHDERYDDLDTLISGVLRLDEPADTIAEPGPDMVFYQPTPARSIFDFIQRASLHERDVLMDLGAGLGHVTLLAAIASSAQCVGIEYEHAYVATAKKSADELQLRNATFLQQDVREADFSLGTVFYLYTPFLGSMLDEVLSMLKRQAAHREIRLGTLGPCSAVVAAEPWLRTDDAVNAHEIMLFRSVRNL